MHTSPHPLDPLLSRQSTSTLEDPAPRGADLDLILDAGLRAPDHGRLRPWRFVLIRGEARAAFSDCLAAAARDRQAPQAQIDRIRAWPLQTPLLIGIGAQIRAGHAIPEIEQMLSAGAAAMNMLNAIHMLGYGGMWVTGANTYDPKVNAALGFLAPSRLVGFLAVGTPKAPTPGTTTPSGRPERLAHVVDWSGPLTA
ncbi:MAG: nitroreductase [Reyranella sp.]|uniref:nitroreductase family protein n=1 Tax=Reyranella sp. TaxID=1929291 RepID=UPI00120B4AD5|nr:nitroreductase [Reyranella sp.]TAJ36075.1 MAG: nitroreductase [Reyranella sp.]